MTNYHNDLLKVIDILHSNSNDMKALVKISGRDTFTFFRGADLREVDLSSQDLSGMNFDEADLRFSNLAGVKFDKGAFNRSILNSDQQWVKDEYEFDVKDIDSFPSDSILIFCSVRPGLVDEFVSSYGITYRTLAAASDISENALRKTRNGGVVSLETTKSLFLGMFHIIDTDASFSEPIVDRSILMQPNIAFRSGGQNSDFDYVSRHRLLRIFERRNNKYNFYVDMGQPDIAEYRDTVSYLESYKFP